MQGSSFFTTEMGLGGAEMNIRFHGDATLYFGSVVLVSPTDKKCPKKLILNTKFADVLGFLGYG